MKTAVVILACVAAIAHASVLPHSPLVSYSSPAVVSPVVETVAVKPVQTYSVPVQSVVRTLPVVQAAVPAVSYQTAAAVPAVSYHHAAAAVPAVSAYHTAAAIPAISAYHSAAAVPAVSYHHAAAAVPAVSYQTAAAVPAYHAAAAIPAYSSGYWKK